MIWYLIYAVIQGFFANHFLICGRTWGTFWKCVTLAPLITLFIIWSAAEDLTVWYEKKAR